MDTSRHTQAQRAKKHDWQKDTRSIKSQWKEWMKVGGIGGIGGIDEEGTLKNREEKEKSTVYNEQHST